MGFQANRGRERRTRPPPNQVPERETRPRSTRGADGKRALVHLRGPLLHVPLRKWGVKRNKSASKRVIFPDNGKVCNWIMLYICTRVGYWGNGG